MSTKADNSLIGAAGVHFVVSELSLRGLIALPTIRNTAGVDVAVTSPDGSWHANLQVKTSKRKVGYWPIGHRYHEWRGDFCYYVFVRYIKNQTRFEAFLESASRVIDDAAGQWATFAAKGNKMTGPVCWSLPRDPAHLQRLRIQWLEFGSVRPTEET